MPKLRHTIICGLPVAPEKNSVIEECSKEDEDSTSSPFKGPIKRINNGNRSPLLKKELSQISHELPIANHSVKLEQNDTSAWQQLYQQSSNQSPPRVVSTLGEEDDFLNLRGEIWKIACNIDELKEKMLNEFKIDKGKPDVKHCNSILERKKRQDHTSDEDRSNIDKSKEAVWSQVPTQVKEDLTEEVAVLVKIESEEQILKQALEITNSTSLY